MIKCQFVSNKPFIYIRKILVQIKFNIFHVVTNEAESRVVCKYEWNEFRFGCSDGGSTFWEKCFVWVMFFALVFFCRRKCRL